MAPTSLRLWALSVDFTEDHRIGKEILAGVGDQYRKLRNTFRYLLGALDGFSEEERIGFGEMPELERYMLALTAELDAKLRQAVSDFDFNTYVRALTDFCNDDLSAFFFDIRKDSLYCDAPARSEAPRPIAPCSTRCSTRWSAGRRRCWCSPARRCGARAIPMRTASTCSNGRKSTPNGATMSWRPSGPNLRELRIAVTEAIEPLRRDKVIGSSLEAEVTVPSDADPALLAELFIVSSVRRGDGIAVTKTDNPQMRPLLAASAGGRG